MSADKLRWSTRMIVLTAISELKVLNATPGTLEQAKRDREQLRREIDAELRDRAAGRHLVEGVGHGEQR